jgi:hypothetical protein|eukprot:COSAG01_NODE_1819_length_9156_cov_11.749586_5_plen_48_part_00
MELPVRVVLREVLGPYMIVVRGLFTAWSSRFNTTTHRAAPWLHRPLS